MLDRIHTGILSGRRLDEIDQLVNTIPWYGNGSFCRLL